MTTEPGDGPGRRDVLRPTLLAVLGAFLYGWDLPREPIQPYYAGAARSMAGGWHAFLFGAVDPAGTLSLDKLPGAFWVQAASLHLFGPHVWALVLPQVLEGIATVLVLYRVVRRWAGRTAATLAGVIMATTPVVVVVDRDDLADTLLVLLLVVAAGALQKSLATGRTIPLIRCGIWIGLAFQAKMVQAWAVLPVFAVVYLVAARPRLVRRVADVAAMTAVAVLLSVSWLSFVWSVPRGRRPYIDATVDDNPFSLAFGYNLLARFGHASGPASAIATAGTPANELGWRTLVEPVYYAPQFSWLALPAVFALVAGLVARRARPRTDPVRAGYLLWGGWLAIHAVAFSSASAFHGYYTLVLVPPIAALTGAGAVRFRRTAVFPAAVAAGAAWTVYLSLRHPHFIAWLPPITALLAGAAIVAWHGRGRIADRLTGALAASALLLTPFVWSVRAIDPVYAGTGYAPMAGPVGSNYQRVVLRHEALPVYRLGPPRGIAGNLLAYLAANQGSATYLVAAQGDAGAAPFLPAGTAPVLVLGGFTGVTPFPTPDAFSADVRSGTVRFALLSSGVTPTPTAAWIRASCRPTDVAPTPPTVTLFDCSPGGVSSGR